MSRPAPETDVQQISAVVERNIQAINAGDVDAWLATLSDTAVFLPPNGPAVSGRAALRSWALSSFFEPFAVGLHAPVKDVEIAGDMAIVQGPFTLSLKPKAGGPIIEDVGKFLTVLTRQSDGSWKYSRDIWNSDKPLSSRAKDPVEIDPGHYKVEFENAQVRVVRTAYGPRERSVMHTHPALVAVLLTDSKVRFALPDGKTEDVQLAAGQSLFFDAQEHLPENLSDKPFEAVLIELK